MSEIRELLDGLKRGDEPIRSEVSRLSDLQALEPIRAILDTTRDLADKLHCYWMLGRLGRNADAPEVANYLMARLSRETTARFRQQALGEALFIVGPWDPTHAIAALADKSRDVRYAAIRALGACTAPAAEAALIDILEVDADPTATRHATEGLARSGTERCAGALVSLVQRLPSDRRNERTIAAALLGLSRLGRPDVLPQVAADLGGWRDDLANWARMLYVARLSDARHADLVFERLTALLRRPERPNLTYSIPLLAADHVDELTAGVAFLHRVEDPRIDGLLEAHWDSLFDEERQRLAPLLSTPRLPSGGPTPG